MEMLLRKQFFFKKTRLSNVERDIKNTAELEKQGWQVMTVWECQTKKAQLETLPELLNNFLMV
jgi:DNA mismatch endonuclease (patch repair protein)